MAGDNNYSLKPVPNSARKGMASLTMVMLGLTFFSASMWTGGSLGTGLSFNDFFLAVLIGNLILGIYTSFLGYIGASTGLSTHLLARFSFGSKGSWLPSALLGATLVGWFGVGVAIFSVSVHKATGINTDTLIIVSGMLMTSTVYFGISALMILSAIAVPTIALLGGYSMVEAVNSIGGIAELQKAQPTEPLDFSVALAMVVGSFISAGTLTADFVRFAKKPKGAVMITMIAFFIGNTLMFLFGAVGASVTGQSDISEVMLAQGLFIPAVIVLGLNIWTTNDNALYASSLGFSNITRFPSKYISMASGLVSTLCALWLYNNFVEWLTFLSLAIPPIGGVIIADFLMNRKRYANFESTQFPTVNWAGITSVVVGVGSGLSLPGIVPINSVLAATISFLILNPLLNRKTQATQEFM
ncbi:cytosine permease [Vibrio sp. ES.051]|uniref:cytosine permease n=1 Tax=Vibrio sp. ES.051 TaxID=1761909 RepID=UPI000BF33F2C|nr:cytosine permease [Vibrio sp. ES.051]PFG57908.1 cytosine permease [Vibrio sp. ES.051]